MEKENWINMSVLMMLGFIALPVWLALKFLLNPSFQVFELYLVGSMTIIGIIGSIIFWKKDGTSVVKKQKYPSNLFRREQSDSLDADIEPSSDPSAKLFLKQKISPEGSIEIPKEWKKKLNIEKDLLIEMELKKNGKIVIQKSQTTKNNEEKRGYYQFGYYSYPKKQKIEYWILLLLSSVLLFLFLVFYLLPIIIDNVILVCLLSLIFSSSLIIGAIIDLRSQKSELKKSDKKI